MNLSPSETTGDVGQDVGPERGIDRELLAAAVCVAGWVGVDWAWPSMHGRPWLIVGLVWVALGFLRHRPALLVMAALLTGAHLGARAQAGYHPLAAAPFEGVVEVTGDPEPLGFGHRVELRMPDGSLAQASAYGPVGWALAEVSVGDRLKAEGRVEPIENQPWLRTRHIAGKLSVRQFTPLSGPSGLQLVPELVRARIAAGANTLSDRPTQARRSLYLGLVIGDDRGQTAGQRMRFRAAGLTHLLAVSGQNVAFVLAVARPVLQSLGRRQRFVGLLFVLCTFALVTRLEPSVLRATTTAAIAAWATATGRERSGITVLCLAVLALIGLDPFLVDSVGFQLSVAASAGILIAGPAIERRLRGPRWLVAPLAVTLSAQAFVSPLLALYFGPVSVASVPANLLAGWAAAAIMTLGLTVGVVAGLAPPAIAEVLQWPADRLLWWIDTVATIHASAPAPRIGPLELIALAGLLLGAKTRSIIWPLRTAAVGVGAAVLLAAIPTPPNKSGQCGPGLSWYPAGPDTPSVLVIGADAYRSSIEQCHEAGVRQVDVVVAERGNATVAELIRGLDEVANIGAVAAPPQHRIVGAQRQVNGFEVPTTAATLVIQPTADGKALIVTSRLR